MDFLAPAMLIGALGALIPVAIHLIGRRRARVVKFAAMDFLLGSRRKTARRLRLRELLLLLVRMGVCLALPLALAKPFTSCAARGPLVERGPQAAVIVVDDGIASGYRQEGERLLGREVWSARKILDQLGPEAEVAIVRAAEGTTPPAELTRDHIRLRDALADLTPSARPSDLTTALRQAAQLLGGSSFRRRTVYLLSPLARTALRAGEAPWPANSGPALRVIDVRHQEPLPNLAVTSVSVEPDAGAGSRGVAVTAEIAYFAGAPADGDGAAHGDSGKPPGKPPGKPVEGLPVSLRIDGTVVARALVTLRPGERQRKRFVAALPAGARAADVIVEVTDPWESGLAVDDRRFVRTQLREEVRVLLVDGDPHTVRHDDEIFYLEAALRPGDRDDSSTTLTRATVDELAKLDLAGFDVIVLANVPALESDLVTGLERWARGGGGLFVTVGDHVDADAYDKTMLPLLPQALRSLVDTAFGTRGAETTGRALRLTKWEADHPIFAVFSKDAPGLREASFTRILLLGPTTKVDDRKVLARYTNGATALVEGRLGDGRVLLFTSSIDRDWNDLAIHPGFLPLVQQSIRYLARKQSRDPSRLDDAVLVGGSVPLPIGDDRRLEVQSPSGERSVFEGDRIEGRKQVRFTGTDRPGFYRLQVVDKTGAAQHRPEADFAVNLDPRASDLAPADAASLPAADGGGASDGPAPHQRRIELWHALAVGLLLLLLLESILLSR